MVKHHQRAFAEVALGCRFRRVAESSIAATSGRNGAAADSLGGPKDELYGEPVTFLGRCAASSSSLFVRKL